VTEPYDLPSQDWTPVRLRAGTPEVSVISLTTPLQVVEARRFSVNPNLDIFHPLLPDLELDRVFAVMLASHLAGLPHRFTLITAYAGRMHDYLTQDASLLIERWASAGDCDVRHPSFRSQFSFEVARATTPTWLMSYAQYEVRPFEALTEVFPLPNLALGVSVSTQSEVDERVPRLNDTPCSERFVHATPREELDLTRPVLVDRLGSYPFGMLAHEHRTQRLHMLDWLSAGSDAAGESRTCIDALVEDCRDAGVKFICRDRAAPPSDLGETRLTGTHAGG